MNDQAREDLALIRRLMSESRQDVIDRGRHFLIWGVVTVIGTAATYAAVVDALPLDPRWTWSVLVVLGWAASVAVGFRDARGARVRTLGRRLLTVAWVTAAVSLTLVAAAGLFGPGSLLGHQALPGLCAVLIASPVYVTGVLSGERWLGWVAAGWWLGGAVMLLVPGLYSLPLMGVMALLLMVVPGAVLRGRARTAMSAEGRTPAGDVA